MSDSTKVWVRSSALELAITGKASKSLKRGLPTDSHDDGDYIDWGWVYCECKKMSDDGIEVMVADQGHPNHAETTNLPGDSMKEGNVLMSNKYGDDEDYYDDEEDTADRYPEDLITLTHLHEPEVVFCLRQRYAFDKIYTATGPILLALNPFKNCKHLYSEKVMKEYYVHGEQSAMGHDDKPLPPHVYGIADRSFRIMMKTLEEKSSGGRRTATGKEKSSDQSILVSGESGAGKTVTTKFIMQYLATLSQRSSGGGTADSGESKGKNIEQQVLQSNPILESFGNARTIRNDNSSRFGKFIEIKFNHAGALVGASVETYLLEKVRLISQSEGERNYHIFYELFSMEDELLDQLLMGDYGTEDFRITNKSGTYDRRDGVEDYETYDDLRKAMETMGMSKDEQKNALTIPCAALHASNVEFIEGESADESALDTENPHLEPFCKLMGITKDALQDALCYLKIQAGREFHTRTLSKEKAHKGMEALIKAFYGALFTFLVKRINSSITVKDMSRSNRRSRGVSSADQATIGVLDIFGFESFKLNSFEQLCINYCNEALQQQFNLFVLKNEQAEYDREGIEWSFITFPDNQDVLDLIDKKGSGILAILDDQCRAPGTTDKTFCIDLYKKCTGHTRFEADFRQVGAQKFGVKHYAGPVEYDTKDFVEKNRDELPKEATDLLSSSTKPIVIELAEILRNPSGEPAKSSSQSPTRRAAKPKSTKVTVGGQFSKQLQDLRNRIDQTSPHYVRCLKPNDQLVPDHFNPLIISDQLRYAGVIEAVRVSRVGYPHRYPHKAFVSRYRILALLELKKAQRATRRVRPESTVVKALAPQVWKVQWDQDVANGAEAKGGEEKKEDGPPALMSVGIQIGKTKIFLRRRAYEILEQLRSGKMAESAVKIQTTARRYIHYRDYRNTLKDVVMIQCLFRMKHAKAVVHERRINYRASKLQALWRKGVAHKKYAATLAAARWIQRVQRGREGRRRFKKLNREQKAVVLQRQYRRHAAQREYRKEQGAILAIQCAVRCRSARKQFRALKLDAKDLSAAVNERDNLREETRRLKQELKKAKAAAEAAWANESAKVSSEELSKAKAENRELCKEIETLRAALKEASSENEKLVEQGGKLESACKDKAKELEQQTKRAESYKKRFLDEREEVKTVKKQLGELADDTEKNQQLSERDEQIQTLEQSLMDRATQIKKLERELEAARKEAATAVAAAATVQDKAKDKEASNEESIETVNQTKEQLATALEEAEAAQREVGEIMNQRDELQVAVDELQAERDALKGDLQAVTAERDELQTELDKEGGASKAVSKSTNETGASVDELEDAYRTIEKLEKRLQAAGKTSSEDVEELKLDFQEFREAAERDIEQAEIAIEELTAELEAEREKNGVPSREDLAMMAGDAAAEEILALQDEINCLNKELAEVDENGARAGDMNSPEMLAKRYEELSRLSIACLEKDKEIDRLKRKIEDSERFSMPQELQNNEEADHLRHYIHELQKEIEALREELDGENSYQEEVPLSGEDEGSAIGNRIRNFLSGAASLAGRSRQSISEDEPMYESDEAEDIIRELEAEVGALREVNEILRKDVEKSRKRVQELELDLDDERARSKQELESFAKTLRGVDELRVAAESMHREVKKYKKNPRNSASSKTNFTDEIPEDDLGQTIEKATKIIDAEVERFEERKSNRSSKDGKNPSFWGLVLPGNKHKDDTSIPTKDDVRKLLASKVKNKRRKKRRGSGSSAVSSFF